MADFKSYVTDFESLQTIPQADRWQHYIARELFMQVPITEDQQVYREPLVSAEILSSKGVSVEPIWRDSPLDEEGEEYLRYLEDEGINDLRDNVSDPSQIVPPHSAAAACDVILRDHQGGNVDMGGGFTLGDDIVWAAYPHLTSIQKDNRALLRNSMLQAGFAPLGSEWWHYRLRQSGMGRILGPSKRSIRTLR